MAIVKMKRLRLVVVSEQKDALLRELLLLGSVELSEQSELLTDERFAGLLRRDLNDSASLRADKAQLAESIKLLDRYAPEKKPLLSAKPEVTEAQLLSREGEEAALDAGREIVQLDSDIRAAYQEKMLCRNLVEELTPWRTLEIPLEYAGTEHVAMRFGTLPMAADFDALCASLDRDIGEVSVLEISTDEHTRFLCVFFLRTKEEETLKLLHQYGFAVPSFGGLTGLAKDNLDFEREQIDFFDELIERKRRQIVDHASDRDALKLNYDRMCVLESEAEAREKLMKTDCIVCLSGWIPEKQEEKLLARLAEYDCAWELEEPVEDEYDAVPVQLSNNRVTRSLNTVTNMYSLPRYGTVDPNPLMTPFFILFYGMMLADMGYGLLMILGCLVVLKKTRPANAHFWELFLWCGISTFVWGIFTAGFFGDLVTQLYLMLHPEVVLPDNAMIWFWQPLIVPTRDALPLLIGSLALGVAQIFTGMAVSIAMKVRRGELMSALTDEVAWYLVFILAAIGVLAHCLKPMLIAIAVLLVLTQGYGKKGVGILTGIGGSLYSHITGYFSDILSYSRLMALMLAGAVISQVFNRLGAITGNIVGFILIAAVGNALNFGLNLLGCYVHDMRLQCLEFFGRFYEDGGKPYDPLSVKSNYLRIRKS